MNTNTHSNSSNKHLQEAAQEISEEATDVANNVADMIEHVTENVEHAAKEGIHATTDAAKCAGDKAKEIYESAMLKAGETLDTSKEYVRRNPVPVVLGAIAFGAALGYMVMMARRKPTFGERYADEPLAAVREAILCALAPVAHTVHRGYDSARDGAGKAMERMHSFNSGSSRNSISDQIGRFSNNLKFW